MEGVIRTTIGQFNSRFDQVALLDLVRRVVARVWATHPRELHLLGRTGRATVSQARFDRVAPEVEPGTLPSARAISQRLNMSWPDVVRVASSQKRRSDEISLGRRDELGGEFRREFTREEIADALRSCAARLGRTPTSGDYMHDRWRVLEASRRAYLNGTLGPGSIPTDDQIMSQHDLTWRAAIKLAGLPPLPNSLQKGDRLPEGTRGVPQVMLLDVIVDEMRALPSRVALQELARTLEVALADYRLAPAEAIKELRARRIAAGKRTPHKTARQDALHFRLTDEQKTRIRAELARRLQVAPEELPKRRHSAGYWTEDRCLDAMRAFIKELADVSPRMRPTMANYQTLKREHEDWPAVRSFTNHGGFAAVRRRAQRKEAA